MKTPSFSRPRRGAALVAAIVGFAVLGAVALTVVKSGLAQRTRLDLHARQLQADWLVESAHDRAAAQLVLNPEYAGETWRLSADELPDSAGATVRIIVLPSAAGPTLRQVEMVAESGDGARHVKRSKQVTVSIQLAGTDL